MVNEGIAIQATRGAKKIVLQTTKYMIWLLLVKIPKQFIRTLLMHCRQDENNQIPIQKPPGG